MQGNNEDALPESLLGTMRLNHLDLSVAPRLDCHTNTFTPKVNTFTPKVYTFTPKVNTLCLLNRCSAVTGVEHREQATTHAVVDVLTASSTSAPGVPPPNSRRQQRGQICWSHVSS